MNKKLAEKYGFKEFGEVVWDDVRRMKTAKQFMKWLDAWTQAIREQERLRAKRRKK